MGQKRHSMARGRRSLRWALLVFAARAVLVQSTPAHAATGLVAGYGFSEGAGTTTGDSSGNGITGALTNSPAWIAGRNGTALAFNGTNTYVDLGNPTALQLTGSMTLSAWVYETANVGDDGQIISKSDGNSGWQLKSSPDTGVRTFAIAITNPGGVAIQRYSNTVRTLNTWYHVTGVYDASAQTLSVYVNGVLDNGALSGTVPASQRASSVNANIGRRTGGFYIQGTVDDVRLYGRALSLAEIQADMSTPVSGGGGDTTPPSTPTGLAATPASASQINLTWTASTDNLAVAGYRVFRNGGLVGTVATLSYPDVGLAASTTYTYAVAAYDAAGNTSAQSVPASATTPPVAFDFSMSSGGNKSVARGTAVTNAVNATLVSGATQPVSFGASGLPAGATAAFSPTSCSPGCSTTLTITTGASTPIGTSTITVTGTGGSLSRTTAFSLSVTSTSDTTPPSVSVTAPTAGATLLGTAVAVSATASDNVGVSGVQFLVDGANLGGEDTTSPYSVTWNTTTATNGPHVLAARARDAAANSAVSANVTVTVDNQAPTGSLVINGGAAATNSRTATLTLSASDALSGVSQMRFSNTGSSYSAAEAYAPTKTWTLSSGAGTKTVYAQFKDAPGNWSVAATDTIVYDATAPTISAVGSSNVTSSSATIRWTTNEAATSQVEYGTTTSYGSSTSLDSALLTAHTVVLSGLATQTTYNYRARSRDAAGNERIGANSTFKTLGVDTTPPTVPANVVATAVSSTQIDLSWSPSTDNVGVTGYAVLRNGAPVGSPAAAAFSDSGLAPATSYTYTVSARDAAGNVSAASAPAAAGTPAFVITNLDATAITATTALVTWSTDQPSNSQVEYGTTTDYGAVTPLDATATLSHARSLSGLTANTTYHYRARSVDSSSRLVVSDDSVLTTSPAGSSGVFQNEILVSGLNLPTAIKFLPTGDLLVLQLGGTIRKVHPGTWQVDPTPFLVLTNIGTTNGQQGLMDLVFDPGFATNHYYYVFYTLGSPNRDRASRFTANADLSGTVAGSELVIYQDPAAANAEHHGGAMNFGNDGKLYVTTGEHFNPDEAQLLSSPRGKVLRFNPDGSVPADNPFYDGAGPNYDAIWALGLRNPYRASYDRPTGRLYIGDVGGNDYSTAQEEVHVGVAGANYGWPVCEGFSCGANPAYTSPKYAYPHNGRDASITGGFIYRGSQFPASYYGNYFFADYAQNWIKRLTLDAGGNVTGVFNFEPPDGSPDGPYGDIVYLCEGPDGALYYVDLGYSDTTGQTGVSKIRRIRFIQSNQPPAVAASADTTEGPAPLTVAFSSAGTSDPDGDPITYLWTFGDGASSTEANPTHTYGHNGSYAARLEVSDAGSTSLSSPITISVGSKPVAAILTPDDGALFRAGDAIFFSGDATDAEDGVLPPAAFTWSIDFLHEGHVHPALPQTGVKAGTFDIPTSGHDFEGNTRYQITLTVTDSNGLQGSQSVIVYPDKVNLAFDSVASGLKLNLDGIPHTTPFVYDTLVDFTHTIEAPDQTVGQSTYTFSSWSDGGTQQHVIVVPSTPQSYVATYDVSQNPLPPGLVAGYRLGEGSGTTTADTSGNNSTGTLVNAPAWTTGQYGNALSFSGSNYVNLGNPPSLQLTGSMTLTAWIRISSNPFDDGAIVAKLGPAGWQLKTSPDTGSRTAAIQISSNGSDSIQRYSSSVLAANTWYHVAGVYDAGARTLSIYVNGVLDNGVLAGTVPSSQYNSSYGVNIAQRTGNPGTFNFLGTIDEVHVFNRALTASEIQTDMNTPR
jgi:glucose/arabinose dehydrogenase/PKD repeat protein